MNDAIVEPANPDGDTTAPLSLGSFLPSDTIFVDPIAYVPQERLAKGSDNLPAPLSAVPIELTKRTSSR